MRARARAHTHTHTNALVDGITHLSQHNAASAQHTWLAHSHQPGWLVVFQRQAISFCPRLWKCKPCAGYLQLAALSGPGTSTVVVSAFLFLCNAFLRNVHTTGEAGDRAMRTHLTAGYGTPWLLKSCFSLVCWFRPRRSEFHCEISPTFNRELSDMLPNVSLELSFGVQRRLSCSTCHPGLWFPFELYYYTHFPLLKRTTWFTVRFSPHVFCCLWSAATDNNFSLFVVVDTRLPNSKHSSPHM